MGRNKKKKREYEEVKIYCFYCDRLFKDEEMLIDHQRARHFKCEVCNKKLSTAKGLATHAYQVHRMEIKTVPNAREKRGSLEHDIYGMVGVDEALQELGELPVEPENKTAKAEVPAVAPPVAAIAVPPAVPGVVPPGPMLPPPPVAHASPYPGAPAPPGAVPPAGPYAPPPYPYGAPPAPGYGGYPSGAPPPPYGYQQPPPAWPPRPGAPLPAPHMMPPGSHPLPHYMPQHPPGGAPPVRPPPGVWPPQGAPGGAPPVPSTPLFPVVAASSAAPPVAPSVPPASVPGYATRAEDAAASDGLVWHDTELSMEERRASLPKYGVSLAGKQ